MINFEESMITEIRLRKLQQVYKEVAQWTGDPESVTRKIAAVDPSAALAIVGEAVGPKTLRLSGVPYFDPQGKLGRTGTNLDKLLSPLGYTLYPPRDVSVPNGIVESAGGGGRRTAYCTDICPIFPGYHSSAKMTLRIRRPSAAQTRSALTEGFLQRELEIIQPKVVLLLGVHAYTYFYNYFLHREPAKLLTVLTHIRDVALPMYAGAMIVPSLHPSPGSPAFLRWFGSYPASGACNALMERVKSYLNG